MVTFITIVLTSFITAIFIHFFSESRDHLSRRNIAASNFRRVFIEEIKILRKLNTYSALPDAPNIPTVLEDAFVCHDIALQEFNLFLTRCESGSLNRLWHNYCEYEGIYPYFAQYDCKGGSIKQNEKNKQLAITQINNLIKFAAPKRNWLVECIHKITQRIKCKK